MSMKAKLLAIVGSHRKDGNCYALAKFILKSTDSKSRIIQLADKKIEFCILCEECVHGDCARADASCAFSFRSFGIRLRD